MPALPGPHEPSDAEVVVASWADPARFASLVDRHWDRIVRYFARRVGAGTAEDLAAETFLRSFRARGTFSPASPTALPWLYGIATNLLRDHARAERQRLKMLGRVVGNVRAEDEQDRVDDAVTAADQLREVARAISELPDDARDVVVLIAVEDLTYQEAAEALGVPVGTIRSRLGRARFQLRRCLAEPTLRGSSVELHRSDDSKGVSHA